MIHIIYVGIFCLHFINDILAAIPFPFAFLFFKELFSTDEFLHSILFGIAFGILLWILTLLPIHKPITGLSVWNHTLGKGPAVVSFCGHILYGIVLGLSTQILILILK